MRTLYLDDSGNREDPITTLAGFISPDGCWYEFEVEARKYLDKNCVDFLHTVDLHRQRNAFKGWPRERATIFANEFFAIVRQFVPLGFAFSVKKDTYRQKAETLNVQHNISPLGLCFQGLISRMFNSPNMMENVISEGHSVSIVVESGHKNNQDLANRHKFISEKADWISDLHFANKNDYIALQAADFLAYWYRRLAIKDPQHPRFLDERDFFDNAIRGIHCEHVIATDFGT